MMFNTFPFGRWPVAFDALFALMGSNGSGGREFGGGGGRALVLFGFGSVWLRDLSMQLCFGFASDVLAVCKAAHLLNFILQKLENK